MTEPRFVTGECALVVDKTLVVSDLHIGIEYEFRKAGINVHSQINEMKERMRNLIRITEADNLVILGDVKHKVPGTSFQEEREIPAFFNSISDVKICVVPGNHDAGLKDMVPGNVKVCDAKGILKGKVYYSHGHTWPYKSFLDAEYVIIGHMQPQIEFTDKIGHRWTERVWILSTFDRKEVKNNFKITSKNIPKVVITPAFNRFAGGFPVNRKTGKKEREFASPIVKMCNLEDAGIYLIDGTYLGTLNEIKQENQNL